MATFPPATVPVIPDGYSPLTADFNAWAQANLSFLAAGVLLRARQTTVQALAAGSQVLSFQAIDEDPYAGWSATATGSQPAMSWLAPVTGLYQVTITPGVASSANWVMAQAVITGVTVTLGEDATNGTGGSGAGGMGTFAMVAGLDYLQGAVSVATAVNTVTGAGLQPSLEIALLSQ